MSDEVIPFNRLPEGFLRLLDNPPDPPVLPRPSATLVLLRERGPCPQGSRRGRPREYPEPRHAPPGLEVLLLKRSPRAGFIPGAWVFPGGTVDAADADPGLFPRIDRLSPLEARERLGSPRTEGPALAYWVTAIRETFEETGVLVFSGSEDSGPGPLELESARSDLLEGRKGFLQILEELELKLDAGALEYNGHWLTPECEPRRYETRFFATSVDTCVQVTPYKREMVDALWITPEEALARNRSGTLRLVFPTLYTLKELEPFENPEQALAYFRGLRVPRRLPRPQRAEGGVRFLLGD